jgi:N-acetylmuramic acid 6-phosphate etherase
MAKTETPSVEHPQLDAYSVDDLVTVFVKDQSAAIEAVLAAHAEIAAAVNAAAPRLEAGGRLIYVGAGTSGRLGLLDSVELYPTFSWPKDRCVALLAGGHRAVFEAMEGAEDSDEQGAADLRGASAGPLDVVILLAASGTTPYVLGALRAARASGALTIGIANNPGAPVVTEAEIGITLDTGSELISGSTRLKAGTAQKAALNAFSSALMVRMNKVYGNLMVDLRPTSAKLVRRAITLTVLATGTDEATARRTLEGCEFQVKVAILAIAKTLDVAEARSRLAASKGNLRRAMAS